MFKIRYSKQAIKTLRKIPSNLSQQIVGKIAMLANNPYEAKQVKTLQGLEGYRLRVGDWRVIYTINQPQIEVWVIKIAARDEVYKK